MGLNVAKHRRLEAAEAEIEIAFELRRVAVGVRQARGRQLNRAIVAVLHEIEARVPAGHDEHDGRQRHLAVLQDERFDVAGEMMHGDERQSGCRGSSLGEGDADQQGADESRTLRHRDGPEIGPPRLPLPEGAFDDPADVANVLARRELRHDAAPLAMDRHLRGDHVRADGPRLVRVAGLFDHGGRGFVAGGFNAENLHGF